MRIEEATRFGPGPVLQRCRWPALRQPDPQRARAHRAAADTRAPSPAAWGV